MSVEVLATTVFILYLVVTLYIGWMGYKKMSDQHLSEYYVAGKTLSPFVAFASYGASTWSAFTFLGAVAVYWAQGLGYAALPVGEMFLLGLLFPTVGYRIWKISRDPDVITLSDIVARRYDEDHVVRALTALAMTVFMFFLMGVQIVGIAYLVDIITGGIINYGMTVFLVSAVLVIYVSLGGMRAVAYTDVMQLIVLAIGMVAVGVSLFANFNLTEVFTSLASGEKNALLVGAGPTGTWTPIYWSTGFIAMGVGYFFWPHMWARIIAAKDKSALWAMPVGTLIGITIFFSIITPIMAMVAAYLWPTVESLGGLRPDQIILKYMLEYLPAWLAAIVISGAAAASMSTVDSLTLVLSSMAFRDLYEKPFQSQMPEKTKTFIARLLTALFIVVATIVALNPPGLIVQLVIDTSYPAFCALAPAIIGGFYWSRATTAGARWSIVAGILFALVMMGLWKDPFNLGIYPGFWVLILSTAVMVVVSLLTVPNSQETLRKFDLLRGPVQTHTPPTTPPIAH